MHFFFGVFSVLFLLSFTGYAQSDSTRYPPSLPYVEVLGLASGARTPFWQQANQFGTIPASGPALSVRGGVRQLWALGKADPIRSWRQRLSPSPFSHQWKAELGAELVVNVGPSTEVLLPQAYGAIKYGNWEFFAGRRKQWIGLGDSTLGTGSYAWSGNALPIPKIQVGLSRFTEVPFTQQWVYITGFYSDGWFENSRPITKNLKFHQKQLYGRLGRPGGKVKLYGGINHQVQWGGKTPYETVNGQMPASFSDYLLVALASPSRGRLDSTATFFDNAHRIGNHLGTLDMGIDFVGKRGKWFFYRQNLYEDGSLFRFKNLKDGLNGIKFTRTESGEAAFQIREVLFEVLYTKNQGGSIFLFNKAIFGKDNYFNHAQVRDGWSYLGRGIGTPFIPPTSDTQWKYPNYGNSFTSNNRVWVLHSGLQGTLFQNTTWTTKLSYSSNAGVYDLPFPKTEYQLSGLLSVQSRTPWLGGLIVQGSLAADVGELYPTAFGVMLGLRKELVPGTPR